jgi:hypothetical protein
VGRQDDYGYRQRLDALCESLIAGDTVFLERFPLVTAGDDEIIGSFGGQTFQADLILPRVQFFSTPGIAATLHRDVDALLRKRLKI